MKKLATSTNRVAAHLNGNGNGNGKAAPQPKGGTKTSVNFKRVKETKNFIRFEELGEPVVIGTIYVAKGTAQKWDTCHVTIGEGHHNG